jgi:hypothetical protein
MSMNLRAATRSIRASFAALARVPAILAGLAAPSEAEEPDRTDPEHDGGDLEDLMFAAVCDERDDICRYSMRLEKIINEIAAGDLTLHNGARGWHYKRHPQNVHPRGPDRATALEAALESQPQMVTA